MRKCGCLRGFWKLVLASLCVQIVDCETTGSSHFMYCGPKDWTDPSSNVWKARTYLSSSATFNTTIRTVQKAGDLLPVYQSACQERFMHFSFPVPSGDYIVTLYGAEWRHAGGNFRVFNVLCENVVKLQDLDYSRTHGLLQAASFSFSCHVNDTALDVMIVRNERSYRAPVSPYGETLPSIGGLRITPSTGTEKLMGTPQTTAPPLKDVLVWSDDFLAAPCTGVCTAAVRGLDTGKWAYEFGDGSVYGLQNWGTNEDTCYQNGTDVANVVPNPMLDGDGILQITALHATTSFDCKNPNSSTSKKNYKSAKITSQQAFMFTGNDQLYRPLIVEARMRMPKPGPGLWVGFRMFPSSGSPYGGWPASGQLDILDTRNQFAVVDNTMWYGVGWQVASPATKNASFAPNPHPSDAWHTYGLEWTPFYMRFYVDETTVQTVHRETWHNFYFNKQGNAPFNHPFNLTIHLAVGGGKPGQADNATPFPATLQVDWVKVWHGPHTEPVDVPPPQPQPQPTLPAPSGPVIHRLYCGVDNFTDRSNGELWTSLRPMVLAPPQGSSAGIWHHIHNAGSLWEVYRHGCESTKDVPLRIQVAVPNGEYLVTVLSKEAWFDYAGSRLWYLTCEGVPGLTDVDIVSDVGTLQAWQRSFMCTVRDGGMTLVARALRDSAHISGLIIQSAGPATALSPDTRDTIWFEDFKPCGVNEANCINGGIRTDSWGFQLGDGADVGLADWGNNEWQCYQSGEDVAKVTAKANNPNDGILRITASKVAPFGCKNLHSTGPNKEWKSARLVTREKKSWMWLGTEQNFRPLHVEGYMKLPVPSVGFWAAFWMLPEPTTPYGRWPRSGELDIMESVNQMREGVGTIHFYDGLKGPNFFDGEWNHWGAAGDQADLSQQFRMYGLEWSPRGIRFYQDDPENTVLNVGAAALSTWLPYQLLSSNVSAPFDQPFHVLLNFAVGGPWPGYPDNTTSASGNFEIDWIKVSYGRLNGLPFSPPPSPPPRPPPPVPMKRKSGDDGSPSLTPFLLRFLITLSVLCVLGWH